MSTYNTRQAFAVLASKFTVHSQDIPDSYYSGMNDMLKAVGDAFAKFPHLLPFNGEGRSEGSVTVVCKGTKLGVVLTRGQTGIKGESTDQLYIRKPEGNGIASVPVTTLRFDYAAETWVCAEGAKQPDPVAELTARLLAAAGY